MASTGPSQQRLSRIAVALSLDPTNPTNSNQTPEEAAYLRQIHEDERDQISDALNISDEVFIEESEQGISVEVEANMDEMKEESRLSEEETEIRKTAQALFALEESLLDQHITNIKVSARVVTFVFHTVFLDPVTDSFFWQPQENAEMLRQEDGLLQTIEQVDDPTDDEMDNYAIQLAEFLDRKEALILNLQSKLDEYKMHAISGHQLARMDFRRSFPKGHP